MLVYSVEDSYTFENLKDWIEDALPYINQDTFEWALIGNKCELNNDVGKERVEARLHQLGGTVSYEISAKTGKNVMQAFNNFVHTVHKNCTAKQIIPSARPQGIKIDTAAPTSGKQKIRRC